MAQTLILAALLAAQSAAPAVLVEARGERVDVGYSELAAGQPQAAIERIQANRAVDANDPAALINLGAAHARMGDLAEMDGIAEDSLLWPMVTSTAATRRLSSCWT